MIRLTDTEQADLAEIHRLLNEAYRHYFDGSDGHCKSYEGTVSVTFGNYWDRSDADPEASTVSNVSIASYVLGPSRGHDYGTTAEALAAVRGWHKAEMETEYCKECVIARPCWCDEPDEN